MGIADFIIVGALAVLLVLAVRYSIKHKGGCSGCSGCSGCPRAGGCEKQRAAAPDSPAPPRCVGVTPEEDGMAGRAREVIKDRN